jgi:hypothetical protein
MMAYAKNIHHLTLDEVSPPCRARRRGSQMLKHSEALAGFDRNEVARVEREPLCLTS